MFIRICYVVHQLKKFRSAQAVLLVFSCCPDDHLPKELAWRVGLLESPSRKFMKDYKVF
jgi:hypothetical protein